MTTTTTPLSPVARFLVIVGSTAGGAGLSPIAPGTVGTVVALPLFWLMSRLPLAAYLVVLVALIGLAIWLAHLSERVFPGPDNQHIVIDEVVGLLTTTIALPFDYKTAIAAFVVFRLFDITKPWPVRWIDDNVHGGAGVVLDDVAAGVLGCIVLQLALRFLGVYS